MCCCFPLTVLSLSSWGLRTGSYVMYTLIVECFSTQIMHIISGRVYQKRSIWCLMVLFLCFHCFWCFFCFFFLSYQSLGKTTCVHTGSHNFGRFSCYHSQKNVLIEILEHPFTPRHIKKKHQSHPVLATSICLSLIFAVAFSFIICCLLPLYHEDIFEKRNVHECLQCPPHWNTWGKVSSLTLWSIPAPQLEPQRRVPLLMRIFVFYTEGNFPHEGSHGRIGITLIWLVGRRLLKIYNQILFGVSELGMV